MISEFACYLGDSSDENKTPDFIFDDQNEPFIYGRLSMTNETDPNPKEPQQKEEPDAESDDDDLTVMEEDEERIEKIADPTVVEGEEDMVEEEIEDIREKAASRMRLSAGNFRLNGSERMRAEVLDELACCEEEVTLGETGSSKFLQIAILRHLKSAASLQPARDEREIIDTARNLAEEKGVLFPDDDLLIDMFWRALDTFARCKYMVPSVD